jgi:hypothetical protein
LNSSKNRIENAAENPGRLFIIDASSARTSAVACSIPLRGRPFAEDRAARRDGYGHAHQNPFVIKVMIGDVVRLRIGRHQFGTLLEVGPKDQRFAVLMQAREQLAATAESCGAIGCTFFDVVEGHRHFSHGFKFDCHFRSWRSTRSRF